MIPRVDNLINTSNLYLEYLNTLKNTSFKGDIESSYEQRLLLSTDNSVYQRLPQAAIFPKDEEDIALAMKLLNEEKFKDIHITARGGGTGTNGQSLNNGLIIDISRYMRNIISFDKDKGLVLVEAGVIKDELNEYLDKDNYFFSPELSTSSRATISGMISNDAAGQGSLIYGRTSTHVKEVTVVLVDGSIATFKEVLLKDIEEYTSKNNLEGEIYRQCIALLKRTRNRVKEVFPKLNRFMTGYDLYHAYDEDKESINLARLICGAEGTLGIVTRALLDLTKKPTFRSLLVVKYENFDSALRHAIPLIEGGALSVETVDSKVLNLAKKDPIWYSVQDYIKDVENHDIQGVNIVEFAGYDKELETNKLTALFNTIEEDAKTFKNGILGSQIVDTKDGINAVYAMRKKSVGLLGSANSKEKLVAFCEDTVVPPKNLANYIKEFRELLDSLNVTYGMFGHVDTGLMHVRPALDLRLKEHKEKFITISNKVVELVKKYDGQMWGEHGRGYRSCFGEVFFKDLYEEARKVKTIFDPDNRLNKGKICTPLNSKDKLVALDSLMRADIDNEISLKTQESFAPALSCNGNGQCFSYSQSSLMCPSYRYTRDRVRSPKGYSNLMREYVRLLEQRGCDPVLEENLLTSLQSPINLIKRAINSFKHEDDFAHTYLEKTKTCVSCKSCKTLCPAHVNAADLNSRFLSLYYTRYLRPSMDLIALNAEFLIPKLALFPKISNFFATNKLNKYLVEKLFSLVDLPKFSSTPLKAKCKELDIEYCTYEEAKKKDGYVIIVSDAFTASYEVEELTTFAKLIKTFNFKVCILKPYINGKVHVIRGDRRGFIKHAKAQNERLYELNKNNTLLGFDPALTICYRDEYKQILGASYKESNVMLFEEWLLAVQDKECFKKALEHLNKDKYKLDDPFYLFMHCTEDALLPSAKGSLINILNNTLHIPTIPLNLSCCGMAGMHGHMRHNQDQRQKVYASCWGPQIKKRGLSKCIVTGFSCRSQVEYMEGAKANYLAKVILDAFTK